MQALGVSLRRFTRSMALPRMKQIVKIAFSDKYLLYTNVTISISLSSLGDMIEQTYEVYTEAIPNYCKTRTMHMATSGAAVGVLCHNWYKILDRFLIGRTVDVILKKLVLDQLIFSPVMILTFFGSLAMFEEKPWENFKYEVENKFIKLYKAEWMVWPPAQVINFYFLPTRFRVLYDNVISLGYDVYTSQVKHDKCEPEEKQTVSSSTEANNAQGNIFEGEENRSREVNENSNEKSS